MRRRLEDLSACFAELGEEVLRSAAVAPSYDGQFAPKVEALAQEGHAYLMKHAIQLLELSERLAHIADDFEEADRDTLQGLEILAASFGAMLLKFEHLLPTDSRDEPEPPPDEDDEKSWLDRVADQIPDPEFFFDLITDPLVAKWMTTIRNAPPVSVVLPMLKGFGMDEVAGPISRTVDTSFWIRTAGRTIGDAGLIPLLLIGWGVSVAPEQYSNVRERAPWNEAVADLAVDSAIFGASEIAGGAGFVLGHWIGGPGTGLPLKFAFDLGSGTMLEFWDDKHGWRESLTAVVEHAPEGISLWFSNAIDQSLRIEIPPIPTPPEFHSAMQTPVPPWMVSGGTVVTPVPTPVIETPSPQAVATPSPD